MYVYLNVILKKVPKWGSKFFFTFPTSEGSDLLSSHVMQTPTFISKLSDRNVIFRLDVGKKKKHILLDKLCLYCFIYCFQETIFLTAELVHVVSLNGPDKNSSQIFLFSILYLEFNLNCVKMETF
jgi:hypothetical protein